jgi:hypothetical protein
MKSFWVIAVLCGAMNLSPLGARAQSDLPDITDALEKTKALLSNPALRDAFIQEQGGKAKAADKQAAEIAGSEELKEQVYVLSAMIFESLVQQTDGDVDRMNEILQKAAANPGEFAATFTPEQREMLREIANKVGQGDAPKTTKRK